MPLIKTGLTQGLIEQLKQITLKTPFVKLHIHDWHYFNFVRDPVRLEFHDSYHQFRVCKKCGKVQEADTHLLGVNPPRYLFQWQNSKITKPHYEKRNGVWVINIDKSRNIYESV